MGVEYIAVIAEEDYHAFKILVSTTLPREYDMWLRVRERGKLRIVLGAQGGHCGGSSAAGGIRRLLQGPQEAGFQHHCS